MVICEKRIRHLLALLVGQATIFYAISPINCTPNHATLVRARFSLVEASSYRVTMAVNNMSSMLMVMAVVVLGTASTATAASGVAMFYDKYTHSDKKSQAVARFISVILETVHSSYYRFMSSLMHAASAFYENMDMGNMVAAASDSFWNNGVVCGQCYRVKCTGAARVRRLRQQRRRQDRGRVREQRRVPEHHRPLQAGLRQDRQPRRRRGQGHFQPHVRVARRVSQARSWSVFEFYFRR
ncbi:hypothetical protein SETIT_6G189900v2 [Setaria italica]|uniref:Expansin-like EG45 domain-containing protein n=1 Tax=Setaria italica TaxID=4555 RepID=A0A368RN53_SETIT|nr:hypothetical protein SETIT_6G189900v2 [Setaria italica]